MLKFHVPNGNFSRSSARLRGAIPAKYCGKVIFNLKDIDKENEVVVFSKAAEISDIKYALKNNIKFIYDVCDDKFNHPQLKESVKYGCLHADLIVCASKTLKEIIKSNINRELKINVVSDPFERNTVEPKFKSGGKIKLGFFGQLGNFMYTPWKKIINDLEKKNIDFEINSVTNIQKPIFREYTFRHPKLNLHSWSFEKQTEILNLSDIIFSPVYKNPNQNVAYKSENRAAEAINAGKFLVTNYGINSYLNLKDYIFIDEPEKITDGVLWYLNNPNEAFNKIQKGQKYVSENFSPQHIAKLWLDSYNEVINNYA